MKQQSQLAPALILVIIALAAGCDYHQKDDYRFVTSGNGECFVFHPKTGKISLVTKDGIHSLDDSSPVLRVGGYYKVEDATHDAPFLKYLGGGKFEPAKFAILKVSE